MDWFRRNWPDLLIGLALIAVIAGIVATLLTGGSFFPFASFDGPSSSSSSASPSVSGPSTPGSNGATVEDDDGPSVAILPPVDGGDDASSGDASSGDASSGDALAMPPGAPDPSLDDDDSSGDAPGVTPVAPGADGSSGTDSDTASDPAVPAPSDGSSSASDAAVDVAPSDPSPAPDVSASNLPTDPYRVSVGAFGQRENAETQAARFRADGFPVFLGVQGDLTLVLVGPYTQESEAIRVADRIRAGGYGVDPIIYLFEPDDSASTPAPSSTPSPAPAPEPEPEPEPLPTPSEVDAPTSGVRLQVGAYQDRAGAAGQIERLSSLGFEVATLDEGGLVKLVIGPFSGQALDDARIVLDGAGIESFAR